MLLREFRNIMHKELQDLYPKTEVDSFLNLLLEHFHGFGRFVLALQPDFNLTKEEEQPLFEALARLKNEEPIQYITGHAFFHGLDFLVNESVLIPRPETEELVQWIADSYPDKKMPLKILDVGTGSGNIAISLAKIFPDSQVTALDVSLAALDLARENALKHGVELNWLHASISNYGEIPGKFNVIVSNPPYVRSGEMKTMKNNVKKYEPWEALFVPDDAPLIFYNYISEFAVERLESNGNLFLEINQYLGRETVKLLEAKGFSSIEMRKDMFDNDRMIKAKV